MSSYNMLHAHGMVIAKSVLLCSLVHIDNSDRKKNQGFFKVGRGKGEILSPPFDCCFPPFNCLA